MIAILRRGPGVGTNKPIHEIRERWRVDPVLEPAIVAGVYEQSIVSTGISDKLTDPLKSVRRADGSLRKRTAGQTVPGVI